MTRTVERIARGEIDASEAGELILSLLEEKSDFSSVYEALVRWTWIALAERRCDNDLRIWHRVFRDVSSKVSHMSIEEVGQGSLTPFQAAERLRALSDLVKVSISLEDRPDAKRMLSRAHVSSILQVLAQKVGAGMGRSELQHKLGLKTANLSRILTLLVVSGMVEREPHGRSASFRITEFGKMSIEKHERRAHRRNEAKPKTSRVIEEKEAKVVDTNENYVEHFVEQFMSRRRGNTMTAGSPKKFRGKMSGKQRLRLLDLSKFEEALISQKGERSRLVAAGAKGPAQVTVNVPDPKTHGVHAQVYIVKPLGEPRSAYEPEFAPKYSVSTGKSFHGSHG